MDAMETKGEQLVRGVVNMYEEGEYEEETTIIARVDVHMVVRPCQCRAVCGGIVECSRCQTDAQTEREIAAGNGYCKEAM